LQPSGNRLQIQPLLLQPDQKEDQVVRPGQAHRPSPVGDPLAIGWGRDSYTAASAGGVPAALGRRAGRADAARGQVPAAARPAVSFGDVAPLLGSRAAVDPHVTLALG